MPMNAQEITRLITQALPGAKVTLTDLAGDGEHFSVTVESALFAGKSRVQQHKMVYDALGGGMGTQLHALAVKTLASA